MHKETTGTPYTDERLRISGEMIDEDKEFSIISNFADGASIKEGVSGAKPIDTLFENTSEETIEKPRSGEYAPVRLNAYGFPHRGY